MIPPNIGLPLALSQFLHIIVLATAQNPKVDPEVTSKLKNGHKVSVVVSFAKNGVASTLSQARSIRHGDTSARNQAIVNALQKAADETQDSLIDALSSKRTSANEFVYYRKFWLNNRLLVRDASAETIDTIANDPAVSRIWLEPILRLGPGRANKNWWKLAKDAQLRDLPGQNVDWNLPRIHTFEAWEEIGHKGKGAVVALIDAGVRHTHTFIRDSYRGQYGWFDGVNGTSEPYDATWMEGGGHGTATTSLVVGRNLDHPRQKYLGVAPDATWMMCMACVSYECLYEHILNCLTWVACPTLPDGSGKDCSKAPRILSMSIAGEHTGEPYDPEFETLRELGIIPVIGIGNNGPKCGTVQSPGQLPNVIGVGATEKYGVHYSISSVGPSVNGTIKPDLMAPGYELYAAYGGDDMYYFITGGTSMATPQVAGAAALLVSRQPELTYEQVYDLLTQTANRTLETDSLNTELYCQEQPMNVTPNNFWGYGEVDVLKAVQAQTQAMKGKQQ